MPITRKIPRKVHLEMPAKTHVFKSQFLTVSTLTAFTVVLALAIVAFTIGVHAWKVSYWPKFNQTEVISDILWMLVAGIIWIFFLAITLVGLPILFGGCLPGSFLQRQGKLSTDTQKITHVEQKFNLKQLTQLSVLWFVCLPAIYYSRADYLSVEQKQSVVTGVCMTAFFLLVSLGRTGGSTDKNTLFGPDLKSLWAPNGGFFERVRRVMLASLSAFPQIILICLFGFVSYSMLGRVLPPFIAAVGDTDFAIFGVVLTVAFAHLAALAMSYGSTRIPFLFWFTCVFFSGVFLFSISTASLIELSRIGNVQNATMIYDRKFGGLVNKLFTSEDLGENIAVTKVDIVFSFGADVVVAKAKTFSANATCDFSWLSGELKMVVRPSKVVLVPCLALPRSAVFSLT